MTITLPPHIFYHISTGKNSIVDGVTESKTVLGTRIQKASFDIGMRIYFEGAEFPQKMFTTPEALFSVNILKAILIELTKLRPTLSSLLSYFNRIAEKTMHNHLLKDEYRPSATRELDDLLANFLISYGLNRIIAVNFSKNFSHIIDFDNAYYIRFVDIMSETSSDRLASHPYKEMTRLAHLLLSREHLKGEMKKIYYLVRLVAFFLLLPKARRAWRYALGKSTFSNMHYDNIDKYWACLRKDYDAMGLSNNARDKLLSDSGYSIPTMLEYTV